MPLETKDDCDAIIVNYNSGRMLHDCIVSCVRAGVRRVIVVDNGSSDGSLDGLEEAAGGRLTLFRNNANLGFAAACNIGARKSSAENLLFLNPDCVLEPEALKRILAVLNRDSGVGMAGGLLMNGDGSEQGGSRRAVPTPWRSFVRAFGLGWLSRRWPRVFSDFHLYRKPLPDSHKEMEAISGACMLVKRLAMADVGLLDEGYFLHCEDLDWCMRFREKGWRILFVPTARVVHHKGGCSHTCPVFVEWHKHKGMIRFYRKFFRHQYPGPLMWMVVMGVWMRFGMVASCHLGRRFFGRNDRK